MWFHTIIFALHVVPYNLSLSFEHYSNINQYQSSEIPSQFTIIGAILRMHHPKHIITFTRSPDEASSLRPLDTSSRCLRRPYAQHPSLNI
jgi:hypothetical protein